MVQNIQEPKGEQGVHETTDQAPRRYEQSATPKRTSIGVIADGLDPGGGVPQNAGRVSGGNDELTDDPGHRLGAVVVGDHGEARLEVLEASRWDTSRRLGEPSPDVEEVDRGGKGRGNADCGAVPSKPGELWPGVHEPAATSDNVG